MYISNHHGTALHLKYIRFVNKQTCLFHCIFSCKSNELIILCMLCSFNYISSTIVSCVEVSTPTSAAENNAQVLVTQGEESHEVRVPWGWTHQAFPYTLSLQHTTFYRL